jgi:anti-sigma regulatory factor (Ser/Thr protein kinase)
MNSSLQPQSVFTLVHSSDVAAVRRCGRQTADTLGFDETAAGRLAIVITEAATNILKHAGGGSIVLNPLSAGAARAIDVIAFDKGPGIADLSGAMHDGVSSAGTPGTGLGAMRRQSDFFDAYTAPGKGSAFHMRIWNGAPAALRHDFAGICVPLTGETECGDAWAVAEDDDGVSLLGADGLGHGPLAASAGRLAAETLGEFPTLAPARLIERAHAALRVSRGAALACARIDASGIAFAGIGNIGASVTTIDGARKQLVSHAGIVGHNMRKVQEFRLPCPPGALCIVHSDGIATSWDLAAYPGLAARSPALVAAVLIRDFARGRDDAMALVLRVGSAP